ncbi:hypothetical protein BLA24_20750 [Streptomyces cinnamoneus]|uniref:Toxin-antitoxin system, toxin component n=1 Tax=Streptomyces cinnamoneus TaxID=53446 RepID=A0A2G1XFM5_STRCJ|nr:hypothetical protein [Streptomyces cinnamoneus]PHQ50040.1 hypothetical protein BLA24_20750 [Streptomyces cinnamoneus]PPT13182.1 hypothetical protein CYQ11_10030 [Streptomyces cinnamoneus]
MATPPQPQPFSQPQPFQAPQQPGFPQQQQPGFAPQQQGIAQQQGFPPQHGMPPQPGFAQHDSHTYCRICGGFPAVRTTVRGHQGILIMMRFLHLDGPFCRNCGMSVWRDMTGKTMLQGWWSPLSLVLITPLTLLWSLVVRAKLTKLPPPVPGQPGPQLDPGVPLRKRPAMFGLLLPVAWVLFIVFQAARGS